jgi:hypothetical protein
MKKLTRIFSLAAAMLVASCSFAPVAAQTLKVATGGAKLTYSTLYKEMVNACGNEVAMVEINSNGSMDNVDRLIGNEVNAAFVQSDVLYLRAKNEELGNLKTLLALHNEQIHIVAPVNSGIKVGGVMGMGSKEVVLTDLTSLAGLKIGASGGSAITAKVIRMNSEITYNVVEFATNDLVVAAIKSGEVSAGLIVGGAPVKLITDLGPNFKLLPITGPIAERLKHVYRPARLNYSKLNAAGITTVSTDALLVTREYKTAKMIDSLASFRGCVIGKIDEMKEATGTHPAWQAVDPANKGKWAWYDLPAKAAKK